MLDFLPFFKHNFKNNKICPVVLLVLDGWGVAPVSHGNAVTQAKTPTMDWFLKSYPNTTLIASGESVGLPANEVGNTEVGHLTLGAGRVVFQDLKRINNALFDRTFFENKAFVQAASYVKRNGSKLHIMGLMGSGNVHASLEHLYGLLQFCKLAEVNNVYLHLFTDGRDSPPQEAINLIDEVEDKQKSLGVGKIASITGRYYAMDRDGRWERTEKTYKALVEGVGAEAATAKDAIDKAYKRNITDEFIEPTLILKEGIIQDKDAVIFFNFRIDRPRQLTMAFTIPNFENLKSFDSGYMLDVHAANKITFQSTFTRNKQLKELFFVTMTEYQKNIPVSAIAYPPETVEQGLAEVLSVNKLLQVHMSESEKERFVTYYFDGLHEKPFEGEEIFIVPSPKVATYDKKPEMSVFQIVKEFRRKLAQDKYNFFVINFANPDMVAHTGNIQATVKALEATDKAVKEMADSVLEANGTLLVTADHGNAEELLTFPTESFFFTTEKGAINTDHSNNPVPIIFISQQLLNKPVKLTSGALSDIAPTILAMMNIPKPASMTGRNLLEGNL